MFEITAGKGFQMTFANGWTVSVQFGDGNYCDNRFNANGEQSSKTAEIAAWKGRDETWYQFDNATEVRGWVTADDVAKFINLIANK